MFVPQINQGETPSLGKTEREEDGVAIRQDQLDEMPAIPTAPTTIVVGPPPLASEDVSPAALEPPPVNRPIVGQAVRWLAWRRSDAVAGYAIVRPTSRQLEIVYWLACLLPFAAAFCAAPALPHLYFSGAPLWAQLMLVVAMLQLGYAAWLGLVPDRSTVAVGMYVMAATATAYLIALAMICFSSQTQPAMLGVSGMRWAAAAWCLLALAISATSSAACGWVVRQWRDQPVTPGRS